ncbi:hypothetical protein CAC42_2228 [Sphaceloma murrayae]|uniref:Amidohydrolase-related domain-containing protein n=1 Tax=Sphaceloma murrayae TaxID=2082308 RepID=A0A2K1QJD6_9PEZI|nr:hypothetical protein CAC42_2228 [Sphaceloma murrayae]
MADHSEISSALRSTSPLDWIFRCRLPHAGSGELHDVQIQGENVMSIELHSESNMLRVTDKAYTGERSRSLDAKGRLLAPSLCHPHVHLDKAFILGHPKYRHLQIDKGTFSEAMALTGQAKQNFEMDDLLVRGSRLIRESVLAGVTHLRAFVEVDEIVGLKCLRAGAALKRQFEDDGVCHIQLCAFAQLPLRPLNREGDRIRELMSEAMHADYSVDVIGSTPYVEADEQSQKANIEWMVGFALDHDKHLDFHMDYSVDPSSPIMTYHLIETLRNTSWKERSNKRVTLGHCTRLIYLHDKELGELRDRIGNLPISFIGLPTSDMYMMKTEADEHDQPHLERRTTLHVPRLVKDYRLNAAIGMNNIGNAFTPNGCCDPLYLANLGVGLYQTGTVRDANLLYRCISDFAKAAIGLSDQDIGELNDHNSGLGRQSDLVLFPKAPEGFETEEGIADKVYHYHGGDTHIDMATMSAEELDDLINRAHAEIRTLTLSPMTYQTSPETSLPPITPLLESQTLSNAEHWITNIRSHSRSCSTYINSKLILHGRGEITTHELVCNVFLSLLEHSLARYFAAFTTFLPQSWRQGPGGGEIRRFTRRLLDRVRQVRGLAMPRSPTGRATSTGQTGARAPAPALHQGPALNEGERLVWYDVRRDAPSARPADAQDVGAVPAVDVVRERARGIPAGEGYRLTAFRAILGAEGVRAPELMPTTEPEGRGRSRSRSGARSRRSRGRGGITGRQGLREESDVESDRRGRAAAETRDGQPSNAAGPRVIFVTGARIDTGVLNRLKALGLGIDGPARG